MDRSQSPTVPAPGGAGRAGGDGWRRVRSVLTLTAGLAAAAGTGCVTAGQATRTMKQALGLEVGPPATQLTTAFQPQVQQLADPTQDGAMRPGIVGQMYLMAADGKPAEVDGDLFVMAEDVTPRPPGVPPALSEMWHFDKLTLRKLKSSDERFGPNYALFLPYPPNWTDVTQIRVSTRYEPKPEAGTPAGPKLNGPPQQIPLDFTPPGTPTWTKIENRPTAPVAMRGIPDLGRAIAQNRVGAPLAGPLPGGAGQPGLPVATTPPLPPPVDMTRNPYAVAPGPNGSTVHTTAVALPPGQTIPPGWTLNANRELVPPAGTQPWTVTPPPAAPPYNPAAYRSPAPPAAPAALPVSPNYPSAPVAAVGPGMLTPLPPTGYAPPSGAAAGESAPLPAIPTPGGPPPAGFDPTSTAGSWANSPAAPQGVFPAMALPPPPQDPAAGGTTAVIRR